MRGRTAEKYALAGVFEGFSLFNEMEDHSPGSFGGAERDSTLEEDTLLDAGYRGRGQRNSQNSAVVRYDAGFANSLYRSGDYLAHYFYLARYATEFGDQKRREEESRHLAAQSSKPTTVLMVAEKPSIAKIIAEHLAPNGRPWQRRNTLSRAVQTYEFQATWPGGKNNPRCKFLVTSTIGHVFGLTFKQQKGLKPYDMFDAEVEKEIEENTRKNRVVEHLQELAKECGRLVLWLDCDREGENICFEVISLLREVFATDEEVGVREGTSVSC